MEWVLALNLVMIDGFRGNNFLVLALVCFRHVSRWFICRFGSFRMPWIWWSWKYGKFFRNWHTSYTNVIQSWSLPRWMNHWLCDSLQMDRTQTDRQTYRHTDRQIMGYVDSWTVQQLRNSGPRQLDNSVIQQRSNAATQQRSNSATQLLSYSATQTQQPRFTN